jgi:hypothetical protein
MDKTTRNLIQKATQDARHLIENEYAEQLEGTFDILPDGTIMADAGDHLDTAQRVVREKIIAAVEHERAKGNSPADSVTTYLREAAFTTLNRFVALKMLEARDLVQECITKGEQSSGFKEFTGLAPGLTSLPDHGYRIYIESLFDEIGREVGVLFDRRDPASLLWPRRQALTYLLTILNASELATVWGEDETIGWVYQYFNSQEERRAMRDKSPAPRNSHELAVRNQFFTPRYVVEFLTDNTLGRIWYEMCQGVTSLKDKCRYLVTRQNEVFLSAGEKAPASDEEEANLTQEEPLNKPLYIEYRLKKDPRDLRVLDPAGGSGHFLLYSFDLLETIYLEAWEDRLSPESDLTGKRLWEDIPDVAQLRKEIPRLILEHNLHGIDIDPRAVQIAALALWMRAQRSWQEIGLKPADRPLIVRTNIVCAEPMPGEKDMRREFIEGLTPRVLGQIVETIFEKMKLAGEAGSLLKIEEDIRNAVDDAKRQWQEEGKPEQLSIPAFGRQPKQLGMRFDVKGITNERFWEQAEDRILEALKDYAERAANGHAVRRQLFAKDTARGFAFIDLARKRYDVVLMNPPSGNPPTEARAYLSSNYPKLWADIYAAFVERIAGMLVKAGRLGAITSRTFLALSSFEKLRDLLLDTAPVSYVVECGLGVLDDATVRAAFFIAERSSLLDTPIVFWDLRNGDDREARLLSSLIETGAAARYVVSPRRFRAIPGKPFAYWLPERLLTLLGNGPYLNQQRINTTSEKSTAHVAVGASTTDDLRFVRCHWEVSPSNIGISGWTRFAHAVGFARYYSPTFAVLKWFVNGSELMTITDDQGNVKPRLRCAEHFFKPGLVSPYISERGLGCSFLPPGHIVSNSCRAYFDLLTDKYSLLAYLNSVLADLFVWALTPDRKHEAGIIASIPIPEALIKAASELKPLARQCWSAVRNLRTLDESDPLHQISFKNIMEWLAVNAGQYIRCQREIDNAIAGLESNDEIVARAVSESGAPHDFGGWVSEDTDMGQDDAGTPFGQDAYFRAFFSHAIGVCLGRWDLRISLDLALAPKSTDPFDPLPVCPPAMLVGPDGPALRYGSHRQRGVASRSAGREYPATERRGQEPDHF